MEKIPYSPAIPLQPAFLEGGREALSDAIAPLAQRSHRQQVVGIVGIGASYCAALAAEYHFRSLGIRSIAIDAGQLYAGDVHGLADAYIGISASGQSVRPSKPYAKHATTRAHCSSVSPANPAR